MAKVPSTRKNKVEKPAIQQKEAIENAPENSEQKSSPNKSTEKQQDGLKRKPLDPARLQMNIQIIAQIILLLGLIVGVIVGELKIIQAILLWILGGGTLSFTIQLFFSIHNRQLPGIESFWGGLDGGIGGWELSKGATYVILVFVFGILFFLSTSSFLVKIEEKDRGNDLNLMEIKRLESVKDSLQVLIEKIKTESKVSVGEKTPGDTVNISTE